MKVGSADKNENHRRDQYTEGIIEIFRRRRYFPNLIKKVYAQKYYKNSEKNR